MCLSSIVFCLFADTLKRSKPETARIIVAKPENLKRIALNQDSKITIEQFRILEQEAEAIGLIPIEVSSIC